jgi:hypothetical protein
MKSKRNPFRTSPSAILWSLSVTASILGGGAALASSHSDAPLIKQDLQANLTDVIAFICNEV